MVCRFEADFLAYLIYPVVRLQKKHLRGFYPAAVQVVNGRAAVVLFEILGDFVFVYMKSVFKLIESIRLRELRIEKYFDLLEIFRRAAVVRDGGLAERVNEQIGKKLKLTQGIGSVLAEMVGQIFESYRKFGRDSDGN